MERKVNVLEDLEGNKIVVIHDIRFKGRQAIEWNIYESDESKLMMKVKGDILHKVRLKTSYKDKKPFLLRNRLTTWFKR